MVERTGGFLSKGLSNDEVALPLIPAQYTRTAQKTFEKPEQPLGVCGFFLLRSIVKRDKTFALVSH